MRSGWVWAILTLALLGAPAAHACVPVQGWPAEVKVNEREAAAMLVQSASVIDLAEVDSMTPDPVQAARGGEWMEEGSAVTIHLRVLQRLKGNPATPVRDLSGINLTPMLPPPPPANSRFRTSRPSPRFGGLRYAIGQRELTQVEISDCYWMDAIGVTQGMRVLVFRDAEGGLLNLQIPVRFKGRYEGIWGPSFTAVSGPDDPWVKLVDKEILDHGPRYYDESDFSPGDLPVQPGLGPASDPQDAPASAPSEPQDDPGRRL